MGEVVDLFPAGQPVGERPDRDHLSLDVPARLDPSPTTCHGIMHVFDAVPGPCQCGSELWTSRGTLEGTPDAIGLHAAS